jgi:decaprenyl-phosphate phosphoribosyltransferase
MGTRWFYLAALRPRQWTKNLIVFAAPLFAFDRSWQAIGGSLLAFGLFCGLSSSFYLLNDLADVESDRRHPVKCHRPIAAGLINRSIALSMALILLVSSLLIGWHHSWHLGMALVCYALLQMAYNLRLKRTVIMDVLAIAGGFVIRAYAGGAATGIVLSPWFQLCTAMLALFLAIEKRKAELRVAELKGYSARAVLQRYSMPLLARMENVVTTGVVIAYALWSSGPAVQGASTPFMLLTLPFVLYGIFRYQLLSDPQEIRWRSAGNPELQQTERPEEVLLKDLPMLLTVGGWVVTVFIILLLKQYQLIQ